MWTSNNELVKTQSWNLNIYSGNFQMSLYVDNNLKFMVRYNGTCEKYRLNLNRSFSINIKKLYWFWWGVSYENRWST